MADRSVDQETDQALLTAMYLYMHIESMTPQEAIRMLGDLATQAADDRFDTLVIELQQKYQR